MTDIALINQFEFNPDRWLGPDAAHLDKYWCPVSLRAAVLPAHLPQEPVG